MTLYHHSQIHQLVDRINTIASHMCNSLLGIITVVTVLQVVLRYVFDQPVSWSEEIALLAMVWFGFLSLAIGIWRHEHIAITYFRDSLPQIIAVTLDNLSQMLMVFLMVVICINGWALVDLVGQQLLPASKLPKSWLYTPTIVGGALGTLNGLVNLWVALTKTKPELTDRSSINGD